MGPVPRRGTEKGILELRFLTGSALSSAKKGLNKPLFKDGTIGTIFSYIYMRL